MSDLTVNNSNMDPLSIPLPSGGMSSVPPGFTLPPGILPPGTDNSSDSATEEADIDNLVKNLTQLGGSINELKAKGFTPQQIESLVEGIVQGKPLTDLKALGFSAQDIQSITAEINALQIAEADLVNDLVQDFKNNHNLNDVKDGPTLPPPTTTNTNTTSSSSGNPYFNVSFMAVFNMVMAEVTKLQQKGHYLDEQVAIQANKTTVSIGKDIAALTLASYEAQAQEKIIDAVSAFIQATIQFTGAVQSQVNVGKGQRLAEKDLKGHQDILEKVQTEEGVQVGENSNNMAPKSKRLQKAEDKFANQKASLSDSAFNRTRQLNESHRTITDMTVQMVNGTASLLQAQLKEQEGQLESLKQIYESYQSILKTYASNSQEASNSQQQEFDKTLDFLNKITDSDFRSFSLSHGA
jgi:hypothetical protein